MAKHTGFWIGFFVAAVIAVPVAMGVWGLFLEQALSTVAFAFGLTIALIFLLLVVFFFKDWILKKWFGAAIGSIETITEDITTTASLAAAGDVEGAIESSRALSKSAASWYAWVSFYRWVIGAIISLLLVFAGFTGTVLLFEQIKRIEQQTQELAFQNSMDLFRLTSDLRDLMTPDETMITTNFWSIADLALGEPGGNCPLSVADVELSRLINVSTLDSLEDLSNSPGFYETLVRALQNLLRDDDDRIAFSALLALDRLEAVPEDLPRFTLRNVYLRSLTVNAPISLGIWNSSIADFNCFDCTLYIQNSVASEVYAREIEYLGNSVLINFEPVSAREEAEDHPSGASDLALADGAEIEATDPFRHGETLLSLIRGSFVEGQFHVDPPAGDGDSSQNSSSEEVSFAFEYVNFNRPVFPTCSHLLEFERRNDFFDVEMRAGR